MGKDKKTASYPCVVCKKKFSFRKFLYGHLVNDHGYEEGDSDPNKPKYKACEICNMVFTDIKEHKEIVHGIKRTKNSKCMCPNCGVLFSCMTVLKRHLLRMHPATGETKLQNSRIKCPECDSENIKTYNNLQEHLNEEHNITIKYETMQFDSFEAFEKWKTEYEQANYVRYSQDSSAKVVANKNIKYFYYNCHRSYSHRTKRETVKINKLIGTNKIGKTCPSHMKVVMQGIDTCVLHFWKTHVGHKAEIKRCRLTSHVRAEVAGQLQQGFTIEKILDEIHESLVKDRVLQRKHLLTKKDIYNIARDFNLPCMEEIRLNYSNLSEWVTLVRQESDLPIIYFKNVGNTDDTDLLKDDFAIVVIVPSQIPQFKKFGNNVVCIDKIKYSSSCEFNLYTIMTYDDEFQIACAIGYCFSNRSDKIIFKLFFEHVKGHLGHIDTSIFISDVNPAVYVSWKDVMSEVPIHYWSKWHTMQDWEEHTKLLITEKRKSGKVYKLLQDMQETYDEIAFLNMLDNFMIYLGNDTDLINFHEYFLNSYAGFTSVWGNCYRNSIQLNIETHLETLHLLFDETSLLLGKQKSFVKTVETLLKIARDNYFHHIVSVSTAASSAIVNPKEQPTLKTSSKQLLDEPTQVRIKSSHCKSKTISTDMIFTLKNEGEWMIISPSGSITDVEKQQIICVNCDFRCNECSICLHEFKCSCDNYKQDITLCPHLHACAATINEFNNDVDKKDSNILNDCDSDVFEVMYTSDDKIKLE